MRKDKRFINIGFNNCVNSDRVLTVVVPGTNPAKRLINDARDSGKLIEANNGRKVKAVIVTDTGLVVLSGLNTSTITKRMNLIEDDNIINEE